MAANGASQAQPGVVLDPDAGHVAAVRRASARLGVARQDAVKQPDGMYDNTLAGNELWEAHADALIAEARQHGFVPYWLTKKRPRGPAVDAWAKQFLDAHRY